MNGLTELHYEEAHNENQKITRFINSIKDHLRDGFEKLPTISAKEEKETIEAIEEALKDTYHEHLARNRRVMEEYELGVGRKEMEDLQWDWRHSR